MIDALRERLISPAEMARIAQSVAIDPTKLPNRVLEGLKAVGAFVGGSFSAPPSSLNQAIGPHRRFETVLADLNEFKAIKNHHGGTVNDAVLAACTGGLRRLLKARGERVDALELRAMVPVSVRADTDKGMLGNRVASMWAALPVWEEDPVKRLETISTRMTDLKESGQAVGAQLITGLSEFAPPTILGQAARLVGRQRAFNLVITNVPGPQMPLYCMGREMREVYPVLPLSDNTTLGIALLSYNGTVGFGFLGDYDTAPDLAVLAEGVEKSIAELSSTVPAG